MNKYFFILLLLIFCTGGVSAQKTFLFKNESKIYDVKVRVENCGTEFAKLICNSKGTFYLLKKNSGQVFQTIEMEETFLSLEGKMVEKGDITEALGNDNLGVYFTDYNFDGIEDLGVSNGNYVPYGGVSYDVYLFSKAKGKFVKSEELSNLETENMSVEIDKKLKIIETHTKSGCCWHESARYRFAGNRLQKFYVFTEDATLGSKWMELVTKRLVGGKWRTTTKRVLIKQYYKD
ncbi:MAG TPA: hypothetical protein VGC97_05425 [Pyrinomonadaceae bacterium]|jgi:hypothetical protein